MTARVFSIANQKGGVGKTTTAVNLATALAATRRRILLVDFDPQGNASTGFGLPKQDRVPGAYEALLGLSSIQESIAATLVPGLDILPSSQDLSGAEVELINIEARHSCLKKALEPILDIYDFILIDCAPSLGLLTLNSFVSSTGILIPLQCEFYALEGLSHLMNTVERIREAFHPSLDVFGILLTMWDARSSLSAQVERDVREHFGNLVFNSRIPRNIRLSEAPSHGKPALIYDTACQGSSAYIQMAREFLKKYQIRKNRS